MIKINKILLIILTAIVIFSMILSNIALVEVNKQHKTIVELTDHLLYYAESFNDLLDILIDEYDNKSKSVFDKL